MHLGWKTKSAGRAAHERTPEKSLAPVSRAFRLRAPVGFVFWLLARAQRAASGRRFGVAFSLRAFNFTLRMLGQKPKAPP